jgi:L-lactate dehydrogenase complex protein LldG
MADLVAIFEANAKEAAAGVTRVGTSVEEVRSAVKRVAGDSSSIVLSLDEFLPRDIADGLREIPTLLQPTDEQLSKTEVGISAAFAGVASTGSVCIAMGPPLAATASLLMPLHIVLLSVDRIVARPRDLFEPECLGGEGLRRNLVFITGPSATADMGPLVRGVHGPHRLQILLMG